MRRPITFDVEIPHNGYAVVAPIRLELDDESPVQLAMATALASPAGYEPPTWAAYRAILRPGDRFVDVGAHVGVLTCLAAALVGPAGRGIAFEPHPRNRLALEEHLKANAMDWVQVDDRAVGRLAGPALLFRNMDNDGGHALWNVAAHPYNSQTRIVEPPPLEIETTTLDAVTSGVHPIRLLKIDTEGAETDVVMGGLALIRADRPYIIAEINPFGLQQMQSSPEVLRALIRSQGYRERVLSDALPFFREIAPGEPIVAASVFNMLFEPEEHAPLCELS